MSKNELIKELMTPILIQASFDITDEKMTKSEAKDYIKKTKERYENMTEVQLQNIFMINF